VDTRSFSALVEELIRMGRLVEERGLLHPPGEQVQLSEEEKARLSAFLAEMRRALFQPPTQEEAEARLGAPLIGLLLEEGRLVRIGEFLFLDEALKEAERRLLEYFKTEKELPMSAFRDLLGTSRRFAVPLLEYFDSRRLTRRQGDVRVLASPLPPAGGEDGGGREAT